MGFAMKRFLCALLAVLGVGETHAANAKVFANLAYAKGSSAQTLDLFLPDSGTGPFPLIVAIHGGAFQFGHKSDGQENPMKAGLARGYAVASINYRLSKEAKFPAAIQDVKAAIRFLRAQAAQYQLDPNRFAAWGGSAGGNLAALAATSAREPLFHDSALGNSEQSDAVQVAVDWYGPIHFSTMDTQFAALGQTPRMGKTNSERSPESRYLGKVVGTPEAELLVQQASPLTYVSVDDPPMLLQHGTEDRNIPITQSQVLADSLARVIGPEKVRFETVEGAGHGGKLFTSPENLERVFEFLDRWLRAK